MNGFVLNYQICEWHVTVQWSVGRLFVVLIVLSDSLYFSYTRKIVDISRMEEIKRK